MLGKLRAKNQRPGVAAKLYIPRAIAQKTKPNKQRVMNNLDYKSMQNQRIFRDDIQFETNFCTEMGSSRQIKHQFPHHAR
jgi:hypothetical protein